MKTSTSAYAPKIVIVGAGFGGLRAAQALQNSRAPVTLIDRSNHHLFQPLLYQVATAGLSPADIAVPIRSIFSHAKNIEVLMMEVTGVDKVRKEVITRHRHVPYDYLVLSTGSAYNYFGHSEWEELAPGLKSIVDATSIRRKILLAFETAETASSEAERAECLTFVIVGGGPTGMELAGSIAELAHTALASDFRHINPKSTRILLVEAGPRIMAGFTEKLSEKARKELERLGVEVRTGARVESVTKNFVSVSGEKIATRTVLWAAGVVASPAGKWLGTETDRVGRVKVNPDLSLPGYPQIFVIGDTATLQDFNGKPLPGVAPVAMQQGTYVGALIQRKTEDALGECPPSTYPSFIYKDKGSMATIGRKSAIAEIGKLQLSGFLAWWVWLVVHIFYLIGFRNRVSVIAQWAWSYFTFKRGARLITESVREEEARELSQCDS